MASRLPRYISRTSHEVQQRIEREPGACPVCSVVSDGIRRHIDALFYELVNDIQIREAIRKAGGFCRPHSQMVARQADALGTSLIFADVLGYELEGMDDGRFDRPPNTVGTVARILDGSVPGRAPCPLCREERGQADIAIDALLEGMRHEDFAAVYERSAGLCMPHFRIAFLRARDVAAWRRVLDVQQTTLNRLRGELQALALRFDYRNADETGGDESDSWKRALYLTAGWPEKQS